MAGDQPLTLAECADGGPLPPGAAALLASLAAAPPEEAGSSSSESSCEDGVDAEDALFALLLVLMAESGFEPVGAADAPAADAKLNDAGFDARRVSALRRMPRGWRRRASAPGGGGCPRFEVALSLSACPQRRLRLVGVAVAGALVANVLLPPPDSAPATPRSSTLNVTPASAVSSAAYYPAPSASTASSTATVAFATPAPAADAGPHALCLSLVPARYVEAAAMGESGKGAVGWEVRQLPELSRVVKDALATPARSELLQRLGVRHAALPGLPDEVLVRVASFLPAPSLLRLGASCRRLRDLSREPGLWRALLRRDFGAEADSLQLDADSSTAEAVAAAEAAAEAEADDPRVAYRRRWERRELRRRVRERWARRARHSEMWLGSVGADASSDSSMILPPPLHVGSSMPTWFMSGPFSSEVSSLRPGCLSPPPRARNASTAGALRQHSPTDHTAPSPLCPPPQPPPLPPPPPPPAPPRGPSPARAFPDVAAEARQREQDASIAIPREGHPLRTPRLTRTPPARRSGCAPFSPVRRPLTVAPPRTAPPLPRIHLDPWTWDPWAGARARARANAHAHANAGASPDDADGGTGASGSFASAGGGGSAGASGSSGSVTERLRSDPWGGRRRRRYRPLAHCCADRRPLPDVAMVAQFLDAETDEPPSRNRDP